MATIIIPTPLRKFTGNKSKVQINGNTVGESFLTLSKDFPDLKKYLYDDGGNIRTFVNVFVGEDDIRDLQHEKTPIGNETVVSIVPAIAGGS